MDLTSVTVDPIEDGVLVNYNYTGRLPQAGAVLFLVTAGGKQYGYKQVDGRESSHFIVDLASGEQEDVSGGTATVRPSDSTFQYRVAGGLDSLFGGDAVVNIDGDDVDDCEI